jgi:hypothetical protein
MAITATSDNPVRTVSVQFYISSKTEERLNEQGTRNIGPGHTVASNQNKILNAALQKAGLCDIE